jgi:hypothetical protein
VEELGLADGVRQQLIERTVLVKHHPLVGHTKLEVGAGISEGVANSDTSLAAIWAI